MVGTAHHGPSKAFHQSHNFRQETIEILLLSHSKMKFAAALITLFGSAAAFAPSSASKKSSALAFSVDTIPGALAPVGLFDPLGFAAKADEATLKRYREAELTHGRVAMLAVSS